MKGLKLTFLLFVIIAIGFVFKYFSDSKKEEIKAIKQESLAYNRLIVRLDRKIKDFKAIKKLKQKVSYIQNNFDFQLPKIKAIKAYEKFKEAFLLVAVIRPYILHRGYLEFRIEIENANPKVFLKIIKNIFSQSNIYIKPIKILLGKKSKATLIGYVFFNG